MLCFKCSRFPSHGTWERTNQDQDEEDSRLSSVIQISLIDLSACRQSRPARGTNYAPDSRIPDYITGTRSLLIITPQLARDRETSRACATRNSRSLARSRTEARSGIQRSRSSRNGAFGTFTYVTWLACARVESERAVAHVWRRTKAAAPSPRRRRRRQSRR